MPTYTFICGCGHSGTTLIANIIAAHPDVFVPLDETDAFLLPGLQDDRVAALKADFAASGRSHLAEKTPRHVRWMPQIRVAFPGARFVLMVRDGRDVAASFVKRVGSAGAGARRWVRDNRIVLAEAAQPDVLLLRYEDLVTDTQAQLERVCAFAGFPFLPAMLAYHETPRHWFGTTEIIKGDGWGNGSGGHEHLRNWQVNQPIFDGRGQWREALSPEDLAFFDKRSVRDLMRRFDYV